MPHFTNNIQYVIPILEHVQEHTRTGPVQIMPYLAIWNQMNMSSEFNLLCLQNMGKSLEVLTNLPLVSLSV